MKPKELVESVRSELRKVIQGQDGVLEEVLVALLSGGHVLLEGVPGLAKTLLARTLAASLGGSFRRVQFTPDLMPSDITGINVLVEGSFQFRPGPLFAHLVLADEVNRTPPKTQAALLQAMEERFVTVDGQDHPLPPPFMVVATQNPVEYEGTYPLPEAQLDRFLMKIVLDYPAEADEVAILRGSQGIQQVRPVASPEDLLAATAALSDIKVDDGVLHYVASIVRASRELRSIVLGASPRGGQALLQAARAHAASGGREYVTPDDVKGMARPVLRHRLILRPESELEGLTPDKVVEQLLTSVPVPR